MENTVRWWHYSEYSGEPGPNLKWHLAEMWAEKTACGITIPEADDRLIVIHWGGDSVDCGRCQVILDKREREDHQVEAEALIDEQVSQVINSNEPPFAYGAFKVEEVKQATGLDGRKVGPSLIRLGFRRYSSGLWRKAG